MKKYKVGQKYILKKDFFDQKDDEGNILEITQVCKDNIKYLNITKGFNSEFNTPCPFDEQMELIIEEKQINNMNKYSLLQDLPTDKAGTIFEKKTEKSRNYTSSNGTTMSTKDVENNPEWFKVQEERFIPKKGEYFTCRKAVPGFNGELGKTYLCVKESTTVAYFEEYNSVDVSQIRKATQEEIDALTPKVPEIEVSGYKPEIQEDDDGVKSIAFGCKTATLKDLEAIEQMMDFIQQFASHQNLTFNITEGAITLVDSGEYDEDGEDEDGYTESEWNGEEVSRDSIQALIKLLKDHK